MYEKIREQKSNFSFTNNVDLLWHSVQITEIYFHFWLKFRESNVCTKEITKELI